MDLRLWFTYVIVMGQWIAVTTNLYDPHVKPDTGPFFEGWYMRLVDPSMGCSLGVLWGYVVPETPKGASKLAFVGALKSEVGVAERISDFSVFPSEGETKYTVKGGKNVTHDPDISSPAWMKLDAKHIGTLIVTQNSTNVDFVIGSVRVQMALGSATPWSKDFSGPEGWLIQRLPLPLHWFVFSLATPVVSYTITDRSTGHSVSGRNGAVHMEKNWGDSFPESWIWAQGLTVSPHKVSFALTYGLVSIVGISVPASLAGYRNYDRDISVNFTPINGILDVSYSQCSDPATLWIQYYTPLYRKLTVNITAPYSSFSRCLFGPLQEGFRRVCQESFVGTAVVHVYEWGFFSGWTELDHQVVPLAALEFGGKWTCQPCQP